MLTMLEEDSIEASFWGSIFLHTGTSDASYITILSVVLGDTAILRAVIYVHYSFVFVSYFDSSFDICWL